MCLFLLLRDNQQASGNDKDSELHQGILLLELQHFFPAEDFSVLQNQFLRMQYLILKAEIINTQIISGVLKILQE